MKKTISIVLCILLLLIAFTGCQSNLTTDTAQEDSTENSNVIEADFSSTDADMFTSRDEDASYDESSAVKIELNGSSAKSSSSSVEISDSTVTLTQEATYIVSGTLNDGMIVVDATDTAKIQIVLNGANITSNSSAPIYIKQANKVFVTLVGDNSLANGGTFTAVDENNIDAVVFSKQDLTFNGSGSLTVTSPVGHGIVAKDDLVITGGTYSIASASHGIDANNSVRIKNAVISSNSGKDGVHAENTDDTSKGFVYISSGTLDLDCEGDGISASSYLQIKDGIFNIVAGGGYENATKKSSDNYGNFGGKMPDGMQGGNGRPNNRMQGDGTNSSVDIKNTSATASSEESNDSGTSMKGLKSTNSMMIENGTFEINSADDAIHSDISVFVKDGTFEISSGDDAIHAENNLEISNGTINISNSYEGLEAITIAVEGGNISLTASDDGLNAAGGNDESGMGGRDEMFQNGENMKGNGDLSSSSNGSVVISGGTLHIVASGDGIDSNGSIKISGGYTTVVGPTQGDTATLDYDTEANITGGTFVGTGASNMAQSFSNSEQGVIAVSVDNQSANTKIVVKDENGNEIVSCTPELDFQILIVSSPEIESGETYSVTVGSQTSQFEAS